ncbi:MAG: glutamate--tRNA ligase [Candidatus Syntrophonatronum acetioxidans]|uniref:Glutamate--tRNA ligase n=1 Tax=Candidatus Syntrophonatronum acetioxidans TaxID=1795816 RepID=A0A424Y986_9FIRM|nr:MAG: glutamate--tRNA ligase [Candidatus Syntrophonatronum acetioxidans]
MSEKIRVRFAPSPTGPLHIGGARSALFNWLFARKHKGDLLVRIEDTDVERSNLVSEEVILDDLKWLGLDWDEGIQVGGQRGPYRQRERLDIYDSYWKKLLQEEKAYYCFCTEEELEEERELLRKKGEMPRYMGKCRDLTPAERDKLRKEGKKPVVRFKVPRGEIITVEDLIRGRVNFESDGIGDFILIRSDGMPTYNFAVVIDDALMEITHVIRGEEHLSNTPRQMMIYKALGLKMTSFAHISLILGEDRTKMSKRHGATAISQYRKMGYLPEALVNFLALLGWAPEGEREMFTLPELVEEFSLDRVSRSAAVFNFRKLNWMNGEYIRKSSPERITEMALPFLEEEGLVEENIGSEDYQWLKEVTALLQEQLEYVSQVVTHIKVFFGDEIEELSPEGAEMLREEPSLQIVQRFREESLQEETWNQETIKSIFKRIGKELGVKGKKLFQPVRVGLTGKLQGPDLQSLIILLGRERVARRLENTLKKLKE